MLIIETINASFISLTTEDLGLLKHISEFFTFDVPSAKFHKAYKTGHWDGKIRLLVKNRFLYSGLKNKLIEFLKQNNYPFNDSTITRYSLVSKERIEELLETYPLPFPLRDYQKSSIISLCERASGLLISPTSSGKSVILFLLLVILLKEFKPKRVIIAVPTISLVHQLFKDFISYCTSEKMKTYFETHVHLLHGGMEKFSTKPITIGTFASFGTLPEEFFNTVDLVFGDECHLLSKQYGKHIFENCINSIFRMGCTGTLQESVLDKLVLEGLFGEPFQLIKTYELIDNKQATPVKVFPLVIKYSQEVCSFVQNLTYMDEYEYIITHPQRLSILVDLIQTLKENTLILFTRIATHGDIIHSALQEQLKGSGKEIFYITGNTELELRENSRATTESNNNIILLCSYGVFAQGINIKNLHNIVLASSYKSKVKILQSIGRGLRLHSNKQVCSVFDLVDDCRIKTKNGSVKHTNYLFTHFMERYKLYQQEQFETSIIHHPQELSLIKVDQDNSVPLLV